MSLAYDGHSLLIQIDLKPNYISKIVALDSLTPKAGLETNISPSYIYLTLLF